MDLVDAKISKHLGDFTEYINFYQQFTKCLFLYDRKDFEYQSSGRLLDCIELKLSVCVPSGTAMAEEVKARGISGKSIFKTLDDVIKFIDSNPNESEKLMKQIDYLGRFENEFNEILALQEKLITGGEIVSRSKKLTVLTIRLAYAIVSFFTLEGRLSTASVIDELNFCRKKIVNKFDSLIQKR